MSTVVGTISINLAANTGRFNRAINRSESKLKTFGQSASQSLAMLGKTAGPAAIAAVVAAGFTKMAKAGEEFNQAMTRSTAIMGNLSDEMRTTMEGTARNVAQGTKFSATEAAESYFYLASAGMDAQQSIDALPRVAKFAQAGMFDMATATDLLTDAQSALGLSSKNSSDNLRNLERVSDVLVKANTIANASVQQFSEALTNQAGAALRLVNKDVEEGVAVLAAFADQGLKGAAGGTALGIVMRDLQTKAIANKQDFAAAGVEVFNASGKMQNMADIVEDLENLLAGASDEQKKMTLSTLGFADKSVQFIQALIGMSEKIREYEADLKKAGGTTEEIAEKTMTAWEKATAKFSASAGEIFSPIADRVVGNAAKAVSSITEIMRSYAELFGAIENHQESTAEREKRIHKEKLKAFMEAAEAKAKADEAAAKRQELLRQNAPLADLAPYLSYDTTTAEERNQLFGGVPDWMQNPPANSLSEPRSVSALQHGTSETISAINRLRQAAKTHEKKIEDLTAEQTEQLKKQNDKLDDIRDRLNQGGGAVRI